MKKPCRKPRCPELVDGLYCTAHTRAAVRQDVARRGTAPQRGYDKRHREWSKAIRARDPFCVDPFRRHKWKLIPTVIADHIIPVRFGGTWSLENGQGVCRSCHGIKTHRDMLKYAAN